MQIHRLHQMYSLYSIFYEMGPILITGHLMKDLEIWV